MSALVTGSDQAGCGGVELLVAEELLLFGVGLRSHPWPGDGLGACLAGALICELAQHGRVALKSAHGAAGETIKVVDDRPTGKTLLDEALDVLAGRERRPASNPRPLAAGASVGGWPSRRRLRSLGEVSRRDIVRWWGGSWSLAEFPQLAPTALCQVLRVQEGLWPILPRVARALAAGQLLRASSGEAVTDEDLLPGHRAGLLVDSGGYGRTRERLRSAFHDDTKVGPPRYDYVVALSAQASVGWLREGLSGLWGESFEYQRAYKMIAVPPVDRVVADAVGQIVLEWERQFWG